MLVLVVDVAFKHTFSQYSLPESVFMWDPINHLQQRPRTVMSAVNNQSGCEPQNLGKSRSVVFYERLRSRFIFYMLQIMPVE